MKKTEEGVTDFDFKSAVLSDSHKLSLYLRLKEVYVEFLSGMSKEYEDIFAYKVLAERRNLKMIGQLI